MGSGGARVPWPSSRFIPRIPSEFAGAAKNAVRTTIFAAAMEQFARRIRSSCSEKTGLSGCRSGRVQLGPATVTASLTFALGAACDSEPVCFQLRQVQGLHYILS